MRAFELEAYIRWGSRFATALGEPFLVQVVSDELNNADPARVETESPHSSSLVEQARTFLAGIDCQAHLFCAGFPLTLEEALYPEGRKDQEWRASLIICSKPKQKRGGDASDSLARQLLEKAACDVLLLRSSIDSGESARRILVPCAGGPHARRALQYAHILSQDSTGSVRALYVQRHTGEDANEVGKAILERELKNASLEHEVDIELQVLERSTIREGVVDACTEDTDLILIGSSQRNFVRRMLFGTLPDGFFSESRSNAIGVLRAAPERTHLLHRYLTRLFNTYVPQLERSDRIALFENLQVGSVAGMDFITLISLATAIAALGLIQNSAAVVIGAMLVAPLMTPMLGAGLGLLQGNILLVRHAVTSIAIGFALCLGIGLIFGILTPGLVELTPELRARCEPNILDLLIALFSGVAAAYAMARPGLLGALPGVAIAAALVPPIATTGIALSLGAIQEATLAAALFGANLVSIILSSAATFLVLGVRSEDSGNRFARWVRRSVLGLGIVTFCLAVPLAIQLATDPETQSTHLRTKLEEAVLDEPGLRIGTLQYRPKADDPHIEIWLYSAQPPGPNTLAKVKEALRQHLDRDVEVRIVTVAEHRTTL